MRPLQKPHPPIWIPGVVSPESVRWAAEHRYPYVALAPPLNTVDEIYDLYDEVAAAQGYTATSDQRGYAIRVCVADTDEKAYDEGRHFFWQLGTSFGIVPRHWMAPPGYMSKQAKTGNMARERRMSEGSYEAAVRAGLIVTGSPRTIIQKFKHIIDRTDPGYLTFWAREGKKPHEATMRGIELLGKEVIPALREHRSSLATGKEVTPWPQ